MQLDRRSRIVLEIGRDCLDVVGIHPYAVNLGPLELFVATPDQGANRGRVHAKLATDDTPGDGQREGYQFGFGFDSEGRFERRQFPSRLAESGDGILEPHRRGVGAGLLSFRETLLESLALHPLYVDLGLGGRLGGLSGVARVGRVRDFAGRVQARRGFRGRGVGTNLPEQERLDTGGGLGACVRWNEFRHIVRIAVFEQFCTHHTVESQGELDGRIETQLNEIEHGLADR